MTAEEAMIIALRIQSETEEEAAKIILTLNKDAYLEGLNKGNEIAQETFKEIRKLFAV